MEAESTSVGDFNHLSLNPRNRYFTEYLEYLLDLAEEYSKTIRIKIDRKRKFHL